MSTPETGSIKELSEREIEILRQVATGATSKEIGQQLYITQNTVKVHLRKIFTKIGVTTRTEAALWAVRHGLVTITETKGENGAGREASQSAAVPAPEAGQSDGPQAAIGAAPARMGWRGWRMGAMIAALVILLAGVGLLVNASRQSLSFPTVPLPSPPPRWEVKAHMPTARSGLAVATYENQVYGIGGETTEGVTGRVERYDPASDSWAIRMPKPVAVVDVSAVVIGGHICIPGGRLASGGVTDVLESYDPRRDQWEQHAPLPVALSGYALVAFEGRLYLFGGWSGKKYLASVYEYDPSRDQWTERTPMPTARSFAGAAVAGGKIYVVGGTTGDEILSVNEEYAPEKDTGQANPWTPRAPLPEGRFGIGVASIADIIHVIGGQGEASSLNALKYFPQLDQWQTFDIPITHAWLQPGTAVVETNLHVFGGLQDATPTTQHLAYKAIYTIELPVVK